MAEEKDEYAAMFGPDTQLMNHLRRILEDEGKFSVTQRVIDYEKALAAVKTMYKPLMKLALVGEFFGDSETVKALTGAIHAFIPDLPVISIGTKHWPNVTENMHPDEAILRLPTVLSQLSVAWAK